MPNQNDILPKEDINRQPSSDDQNILQNRLAMNQSPILPTDEYAKLNQGVPLNLKNLNPENIPTQEKVLLTQPETQP